MSNSVKKFEPQKVVIADVDGVQYDVTKAVGMFSYYEDIYQPFVTANMLMVDSGQNFIGNLPIQGGEEVIVKLINVRKEAVEYKMRVQKIVNRSVERNMQYYTLVLISKEGLENDTSRVTEKYKANSEAIVKDVLKNVLKTDKELFAELLGEGEARGKDVSDMLLRFAGSGGNTVGEKFQQYIGAEAMAGHSRTEKINQGY